MPFPVNHQYPPWGAQMLAALARDHYSDGSNKNVPPVLNVKTDYGAVGDGTTDDTLRIQAACDDAFASYGRVYFPEGTYLTGSINWKYVPLFGAGQTKTHLLGKPSQDIIHVDTTYHFTSYPGWYIRDLELIVDDSADAAASFPQRGGVGNAALAVDFPDGSVTSIPILYRGDIQNLTISSISMNVHGVNNSAGIYEQMPSISCRWRGIWIWRLKYGWQHHYPTSNATSVEIAADHNHYDSIQFNGCGSSMRHINAANCVYTNIIAHLVDTLGISVDSVTSQIRTQPAQLTFNGVFIESANDTPWKVTGTGHVVKGLSIAGAQSLVTIDSLDSVYEELSVVNNANTGTQLRFATASRRNLVRHLTIQATSSTPLNQDLLDDLGQGNVIESWAASGGANVFNSRHTALSLDDRRLHHRDATAAMMGYTTPFVSGNDLLVNPSTFKPGDGFAEGADYSYVTDATADLGVVFHRATTGGFNLYGPSGCNGYNGQTIGQFLPAGKVRVYIKAKANVGCTQSWHVWAPAGSFSALATNTLTWTTSYTVQSFDVDFTGQASFDIGANSLGGSGTTLDVQWIMFRPYQKDHLMSGAIKHSLVALSYGGTIATDASLGDLFSVAATNGTAFTIVTPTNPETGQAISYDIQNSSGGTMGAITFGTAFLTAGTLSPPANGKRRTLSCYYDGTNWVETNRAAGDI